MNKKIVLLCSLMLFYFQLLGCTQQIMPTSTATFEPIITHTPVPTPTPTRKTDIDSIFFSEERYYVYEGEYSFVPVMIYQYETQGFTTIMGNIDGTVTIGLAGGPDVSKESDEELSYYFLDALFKRLGSYSLSSPEAILIDGVDGTSFSLTASISSDNYQGKAVSVRKGGSHYFFAFGMGKIVETKNMWEGEGQKVFTKVLDSVEFLNEDEIAAANICKISSDPTYGYSKDNPIKVGGDAFGGPSRERAYLDALAGPDGEAITYTRVGSQDHNNTILDAYQISYVGLSESAIIYIDEYSFETLYAPLGFTCLHAIPLGEP